MAGKNKWYRGGLAFECRGCGNCCSGPEEGYVWISAKEIERAAEYLKMSVEEFKRRFARRVGLRYSLIEKQPSKDCIFLAVGNNGKGCEIYPVRPVQCRTWPFWKENLRGQKSWTSASEKCSGIDRGRWYDYDIIEELQKGDFSGRQPKADVRQAAWDWIKANHKRDDYAEAINKVYDLIEKNLNAVGAKCDNCGKCCDFEKYDHRLYATTLEMAYFLRGVDTKNGKFNLSRVKRTEKGRCPLQDASKGCRNRNYRTAGCRIFYCRSVPVEWQSELSEKALKRIRLLHRQFAVPYYYADLREWMVLI